MNHCYAAPLIQFIETDTNAISNQLPPEDKLVWHKQIELLKLQCQQLPHLAGDIVLSFSSPTSEPTISAIVLYRGLVFVLGFGFESQTYQPAQLDTLHNQARMLKDQHIGSQAKFIIPVSIETQAAPQGGAINVSEDLVADTMCDNGDHLAALIEHFANQYKDDQIILSDWLASGFRPH